MSNSRRCRRTASRHLALVPPLPASWGPLGALDVPQGPPDLPEFLTVTCEACGRSRVLPYAEVERMMRENPEGAPCCEPRP